MAELAIAQTSFPPPRHHWRNFSRNFRAPRRRYVALLTIGDLQLKDYTAQLAAADHLPAATNQLVAARNLSPVSSHLRDSRWPARRIWTAAGVLAGGTTPRTLDAFGAAATNLFRRKTWPWRVSKWATPCSRKSIHQRVEQLPPGGGGTHRFSRLTERSATARSTRWSRANLE